MFQSRFNRNAPRLYCERTRGVPRRSYRQENRLISLAVPSFRLVLNFNKDAGFRDKPGFRFNLRCPALTWKRVLVLVIFAMQATRKERPLCP